MLAPERVSGFARIRNWLTEGFRALANEAAVLVTREVGVVAAEDALMLVALLALWIIPQLRPKAS